VTCCNYVKPCSPVLPSTCPQVCSTWSAPPKVYPSPPCYASCALKFKASLGPAATPPIAGFDSGISRARFRGVHVQRDALYPVSQSGYLCEYLHDIFLGHHVTHSRISIFNLDLP
ncbi:hypothetical protein C8R44DRAFT_816741, partial [Mycena epipterygia]